MGDNQLSGGGVVPAVQMLLGEAQPAEAFALVEVGKTGPGLFFQPDFGGFGPAAAGHAGVSAVISWALL